MTQGQIIFLNGTSSAGKSTLAAALQKTLPEPYLYLAVDDYLARFSPSFWQDQGPGWSRFLPAAFSDKQVQRFQPLAWQPGLGWLMLPQLISSFHQQVADKAQAGHSIILDHVLAQPRWLEECVRLFEGAEVIFVGVYCPLEEAERREQARGDRRRGTARYHYDRVHGHGCYDLKLDTSTLTPEAGAALIVEYLHSSRCSLAFTRLRQSL